MAEIFVYISNSLVHLKHILIDFQNQKNYTFWIYKWPLLFIYKNTSFISI